MNRAVTLNPPGPPWFYEEDLSRSSVQSFEVTLTESIKQMMFVSGETAEPSVETTGIIEDIVRQQVIELVSLRPQQTAPIHDALTLLTA